MTLQEQKLKVALNEAIQKWIDEQCESDEWTSTDIIVHNEIGEDMTEAAFTIFKAVAKSQRYALNQGYFKVGPTHPVRL